MKDYIGYSVVLKYFSSPFSYAQGLFLKQGQRRIQGEPLPVVGRLRLRLETSASSSLQARESMDSFQL
jgi:hypothetical protein